jgi:hypothetical protein
MLVAIAAMTKNLAIILYMSFFLSGGEALHPPDLLFR